MCKENNYIIGITHLINTRNEDLGLKSKNIRAKLGIDLSYVIAWRESYDDDGIPDGTVIYTGNDSFFMEINFFEFLKNLKDFHINDK